jgi:hypothetical protein
VRELVGRTGVDELMVTTNTHDGADRIRSYELLSQTLAPASVGCRSLPRTRSAARDVV